MARFKVELSENVQRGPDFTDQKVSATRSEQSIGNHPPELPRDFTNAHVLSDYDGSEPSSIITGLCPDMCPGMSLNFLIYEQSCNSVGFNCNNFVGLDFLLIVWERTKIFEKLCMYRIFFASLMTNTFKFELCWIF